MTQKEAVLQHLMSGKLITQLEATRKYGILRLAPIIFDLRKEGYPIGSNEIETRKKGTKYSQYFMGGDVRFEDEPPLFNLDGGAHNGKDQEYDTLDNSGTALQQGKPPQVGGTEIRSHHLGNPGDRNQILESFRAYCRGFGFKKVPITCDWSRQLLKLNRDIEKTDKTDHIRNRDISSRKRQKTLESFKKALQENTLFYTNIGIGFDWDGYLADGQTRLTASLETGLTFFADVTFDMDPKAFAVIDSPDSARTSTDLAYMFGINEHQPAIVAAVSLVYRKENGLAHGEKLQPDQVMEALRTYSDIGPSVKLAKRFKVVRAPKAVIAGVHYLASRINKAVADKTFEDFISGANNGIDDPVLVARERLRRSYSMPGNEFRGYGDKKVRIMLSRMFNYRLANIRTTKFMLDSGDDWPGDKIKGGGRKPGSSDTTDE